MNDATKTAVISQTGMGQAIGLAARGHSIRKFAKGQMIAEFIGTEILEKLENPLKFQYRPSGTDNLIVEANGYDVTLLIARVSKDNSEYESFVDRLFGVQQDLFRS